MTEKNFLSRHGIKGLGAVYVFENNGNEWIEKQIIRRQVPLPYLIYLVEVF